MNSSTSLSTQNNTPVRKNEVLFPSLFLLIGVALFIVYAYTLIGTQAIGPVLAGLAIKTTVSVILNVIACYIASTFLGSLGYLHTAILKLAAITVFTAALAVFLIIIPIFGVLILAVIYIGLLEWFFELDIQEVIILAILIFIVHIVIADVLYSVVLSFF